MEVPGRGGWNYGPVNSEFVTKLRGSLQKVRWVEDTNDDSVFKTHSKDKSCHPTQTPDVVVFPQSSGKLRLSHTKVPQDEVVSLVRLCNESKIPVIPRGAGTGLEGGCIPYQGGVVCDTSELKKLEVDADNMLATVGAGVLKDSLNKFLEPHGFFFGPDPSSNPSLGTKDKISTKTRWNGVYLRFGAFHS